MHSRCLTRVLQSIVVVIVAGCLLIVGRLTVASGPTGAERYQVGHRDGYDEGYLAGLHDGVVQGRQEGRALQEGDTVPAGSRRPVQVAFNDGYAAGANDVFGGYDGGWALTEPYVVTLERARAPIVYRIGSRTPLQFGVSYFLCPNGRDLCQEPRR